MEKLFLVLAFLLSFSLSPGAVAASLKENKSLNQAEYAADEVVVKFETQATARQIEEFHRIFGTRLIRPRRFADFVTLRLPKGIDAKQFAKRLADDPRVEYAEPNYIAYALMVPNDPYYSYQWHFDNPDYGGVRAQQAWDFVTGSGVKVAIVDTGVAYENYRPSWWERYEQAPDLAGTCFAPGYDFVNNDGHPDDDEGHGTHVAGTVAQTTNNHLGVAGLAHSACLMPVKVLDNQGRGTYADIAEGIRFAADNGAQVINLSLGGSAEANTLYQAVAYARDKGATIVAAAGNESAPQVLYPAAYDEHVIAVGATRYDETLAFYSNYGPSLDLVAPGGDLSVDQNNDGYGDGVLQQTFDRNPRDWGYWFYQGTSMASPHVAAVAALVIANGVSGPDDVRAVLESSAQDLGDPGRDDIYGWGLVDAAAVLGVKPKPAPSPTPKPTLTPTPITTPSPTFTPTLTPTPAATPTATPTPELTPTSTPMPTPIPAPPPSTPTPVPTPPSTVICWQGDYQYLYRSRNQAKKFCLCAQGTYGYNSYSSGWERGTAYQYLDSGNNENWQTTSLFSRRLIYRVKCFNGDWYNTDRDYYF